MYSLNKFINFVLTLHLDMKKTDIIMKWFQLISVSKETIEGINRQAREFDIDEAFRYKFYKKKE